ncbi:MAG: hypothetical protein P4L41_14345 [Flavipsychrobacter sp.]|nr:hypothetical protein [Flavipsychrobacter sp.]
MSVNTPVLYLVFNRPDATRQSFAAIREAKPKHLYVAADGPRAHKPGEAALCEEVRKIATNIDWDCELHTLFREQNLGCGLGVSGGINWFFENVEQGIIIEDDCIVDQSFFPYCEELLEKYKDNTEVMHIGGNNFITKDFSDGESYYFIKYFTVWGWATWRRAWKLYDIEMHMLDDFLNSGKLEENTLNAKHAEYWREIFEATRSKKIDTWDYQWVLTCWYYSSYAIMPVLNLVTNVGFGEDATHTRAENKASYMTLHTLEKVVHPARIARNRKADMLTYTTYFDVPQHLNIARNVLYKVLPTSAMMQLRKIRRKFFPGIK